MTGAKKQRRRLVSKTDLARMGGVSQAAVTKLARGKLSAGLVGDRLDIDHEAVKAWLTSKGWADGAGLPGLKPHRRRAPAPTRKCKSGQSGAAEPTAPGPPAPDERRSELDDLQLQISRERLRERALKNELAEGRVVDRQAVQAHVFGAIATMFKRFLEDVPHTIVSRLYSAQRAGESLETGKAIFIEVMQGQLEAVKAVAIETLRES